MTFQSLSLHDALCDAGLHPILAECLANEDPEKTFFAATLPERQLIVCDFEDEDPITALQGNEFPPGLDSVVVVTHGADRLVPAAQRHRIIVGVTDPGAPIRSFVWGYGRVQALSESSGLLPDAILRALGRETPRPTLTTSRFWLLVWLSNVLASDGDVDLEKLAQLHPATEPGDMEALGGDDVQLWTYLCDQHRDYVAGRDWEALRLDALVGQFPFHWLASPVIADWHDEGSFARSVDSESWDAVVSMITDRSIPHWEMRQLAAQAAGVIDG